MQLEQIVCTESLGGCDALIEREVHTQLIYTMFTFSVSNNCAGLFASVASELDPAGQELLCELLVKNIETVVTLDSKHARSPSKGGSEGEGNEGRDGHRGRVEIRLKR